MVKYKIWPSNGKLFLHIFFLKTILINHCSLSPLVKQIQEEHLNQIIERLNEYASQQKNDELRSIASIGEWKNPEWRVQYFNSGLGFKNGGSRSLFYQRKSSVYTYYSQIISYHSKCKSNNLFFMHKKKKNSCCVFLARSFV